MNVAKQNPDELEAHMSGFLTDTRDIIVIILQKVNRWFYMCLKLIKESKGLQKSYCVGHSICSFFNIWIARNIKILILHVN